jgi:GLPGLI family protein
VYFDYRKREIIFFKLDKMRVDKKLIVDILIGDGLFYSNIKDSYLLEEKVTFDKNFLIKHEKINWTLINEEKKIGNYLCKKATTKKTVVNSSGEFTTAVIAWYAPSIPLNFGPKNFNGLPGLILELTDRQMVYKVSKLELNTNNKKYKIKLPKNGKFLTYEEYEKELKSLFYKYRN